MRLVTVRMFVAGLVLMAIDSLHSADVKVRIGYPFIADFASVFVAKEQGIFAKRGIDAELVLIPIGSSLPAALISKSIDIGGAAVPVLLQAAAADLKLVVVSGVSVNGDELRFAAMARSGVTFKDPKDFENRKVGVPGIGASLHILFVRWLKTRGVDPRRLTFVEVPFPAHADVLKSGIVDFVVTAQPTIDGIVSTGTGTVAIDFAADLKGRPGAYWISTSAWAQANPEVVKNYREATREAGVVIDSNPALAREEIAKYIKLPPPVIASLLLPKVVADVKITDIEWWMAMLNDQNLLDKTLNASDLVTK
jgi:NitT/TauT family transport system substrate-binding protein